MLLNSSYCQLCNKYLNFCQANPNLAKLGSIIPVRNRIYMFSLLYVFVCVFQITRLWNWILTQITFKGFHSCMCSFMFFQIARLWKWLLTEITFKCFTLVWVDLCLFKLPDCEIDILHKSHLYGFIPVCVCLCLFKFQDCENDFSHKSHLNGLTPVCVCWARSETWS